MRIVIKPIFGLCNRLRFMFSYYKFAKENNKKLIVIWEIDDNCPGFYLDYFKPIDGVTFKRKDKGRFKIDASDHGAKPGYNPDYKELKLLPSMISIIKNKMNLLGEKYIALHIRRTDHTPSAQHFGKYNSDKKFLQFIKNHKNKNNNNNFNIYLATDNKETYEMIHTNYNLILPYHNTVDGLRQTSLQDSIIDLFMCVYADNFIGTDYSSFSMLIEHLRNKKKYKNKKF